jgi:hypothetical protein
MARHFANALGFVLDAEYQRVGGSNLFKAAICAQAWERRPLLSGLIEMPSGSGAKSSETSQDNAVASFSRVVTVGFFPPRSRWPAYERSMFAASARSSCEIPFETRKRLKFSATRCRASIAGNTTFDKL